ncbi:MAG: family 43 glycosylhydrolase [Verrucomicrobiae bacterium]|nr:family 43 glycosylhydrolase [Verrucomicrobiae bacterium]
MIEPAKIWSDDRGRHIQAHGGAIIRVDGIWYWFGEDRSSDNEPGTAPVACYASGDLMNWEFRGKVFKGRNPANIAGEWVIERPKVFPCPRTGKFVMYLHIDGQIPGHWSRYRRAEVGIATSDTVDGTYKWVRSFRPLGKESRDIGQFIDDDGQAYLIFECRPEGGFHIARLSDDRMDVTESVAFIRSPIEGGSIVRHNGLYYCIGSLLTGWWPNANKYATAERLEGPWSEFRDIAPPESLTYGSQSTHLLKVVGTKTTTVIFMGDVWRPYELTDSRYLWYPLTFKDGRMSLEPSSGFLPGPWSIDTQTGKTVFEA